MTNRSAIARKNEWSFYTAIYVNISLIGTRFIGLLGSKEHTTEFRGKFGLVEGDCLLARILLAFEASDGWEKGSGQKDESREMHLAISALAVNERWLEIGRASMLQVNVILLSIIVGLSMFIYQVFADITPRACNQPGRQTAPLAMPPSS